MDLSCCGELDEGCVTFGILSIVEGENLVSTLKLPTHLLDECK